MSAISLKSITGITSITTPAGVDNQLTLHTNDTTQRVKVTQSGIEVVGVATFQDIDVDGHTNLDNVSIAGVTTHQDDVAIRSSNPLILSNAANNASCQVLVMVVQDFISSHIIRRWQRLRMDKQLFFTLIVVKIDYK